MHGQVLYIARFFALEVDGQVGEGFNVDVEAVLSWSGVSL